LGPCDIPSKIIVKLCRIRNSREWVVIINLEESRRHSKLNHETANTQEKLALFDKTFSFSLLFPFQNKNNNKQPKTRNNQNYFHLYVTSEHFLKQKKKHSLKSINKQSLTRDQRFIDTCPPVVLGTTEIEAMSTYVWVVINTSTQTWKYHDNSNEPK